MKSLIPCVMIAAPTSVRHSHLLKDWIKHLDDFTYQHFDVLLVDTTEDNGEYGKTVCFSVYPSKKLYDLVGLRKFLKEKVDETNEEKIEDD